VHVQHLVSPILRPTDVHTTVANGLGLGPGMHFNIRRSLSVAVTPPGLTPAKSLQTATTNTNDHSDRSAATEYPLLPAPATAKDVPSRPRRNSKSVQIRGGFRSYWAAFKKKVASGTPPSTPSLPDDSTSTASYIHKPQGSAPCEQDDHVDVVVVDRVWGEDPKWSAKSDSSSPLEDPRAEDKLGSTNTDPGSSEPDTGFWASSTILLFFRWRIWPLVWGFFWLRFADQEFEVHYVKETWFLRKRLALFSAVFFVINWLLPVILITRPVTLSDAIFYYGVSGPSGLDLYPSKSNARIGWPCDLSPPGFLGDLRLPSRSHFVLSDLPLFCRVVLASVPSGLHARFFTVHPSCSYILLGTCVDSGTRASHM
jgi:hypothetical protein